MRARVGRSDMAAFLKLLAPSNNSGTSFGGGGVDSITARQRQGDLSPFNLTFGHAYQEVADLFEFISSSIQEALLDPLNNHPVEYERRFLGSFKKILGSPGWTDNTATFSFMSATQGLQASAEVVTARGVRSVLLIDPVFDHVCKIFRRRGFNELRISEALITDIKRLETLWKQTEFGAIVLVNPNNPTGYSQPLGRIERTLEWAKARRVVVIWDASFRAYDPGLLIDIDAMLASSGSEYILIDDTGKTIPLAGIKAAMVTTSPELASYVRPYRDECLLSLSPIVSESLCAAIRFAELRGGIGHFLKPVAINRTQSRDSFLLCYFLWEPKQINTRERTFALRKNIDGSTHSAEH